MAVTSPKCPRCKQLSARIEDGFNVCLNGHRWAMEKAKPISHETLKEDIQPMGKYNECKNCGRTMTIKSHGMCGVCADAVHNIPHAKGSPEYKAVLTAVKEKVLDPDFKKLSAIRKQASETARQNYVEKKGEKGILEILEDRKTLLRDEYVELERTIETIKKYMAA